MIDPKPFVGDPAFDLAQWLHNRYWRVVESADPIGIVRGEIERFAENLGMDAGRIAGWAFVKALGWDCGPEMVRLFRKWRGDRRAGNNGISGLPAGGAGRVREHDRRLPPGPGRVARGGA